MGRFCGLGSGRSPKTVGLVLMGVGLLILVLSVPSWMWASVLGIVMVSVGFLIWRFG